MSEENRHACNVRAVEQKHRRRLTLLLGHDKISISVGQNESRKNRFRRASYKLHRSGAISFDTASPAKMCRTRFRNTVMARPGRPRAMGKSPFFL